MIQLSPECTLVQGSERLVAHSATPTKNKNFVHMVGGRHDLNANAPERVADVALLFMRTELANKAIFLKNDV